MIRPYTPDDRERVVELWFRSASERFTFLPASFWEKEKASVRDDYLPIAQTWVYEDARGMAGFVAVLCGHEVGGLFVLPERQGEGIGRALIEFAASEFGPLILGVFAKNKKAIGFYKHLGFTPHRKGRDAITGQADLWMIREVDA